MKKENKEPLIRISKRGVMPWTQAWSVRIIAVILALIVLLCLYFLFRDLAKKRGFFCWLAGIVLLLSVMVFGFVGLWGLNHFGPSAAEQLGMTVTPYSQEQLVSYLKNAGFTHIAVYADRSFSVPGETEQRIYLKARKGKGIKK